MASRRYLGRMSITKVILLPRRARPFFARHPWVFAGSIACVAGPAEAGTEVAVFSHERQFVARGLFNPHSAIRVRQATTLIGTEPPDDLTILANGLRFAVNLRSGQKTGFYLDQRDNREVVAHYISSGRMLDLFCYTGGFALNAIRNGSASHSLGLDSSSAAIEMARANAVANGIGTARFETADVFEALDKLRARGERFGLVVCDPPKFARSSRDIAEALKGYLRLNRAAADVV